MIFLLMSLGVVDDLASGLGDGEAVLQHLEARNEAILDGEDDGEGGLDHLAGRFDPRRELADDHRPGIAREDFRDVEPNGFRLGADAAKEVGNRTATSPPSDPRKGAFVALDFDQDVLAEPARDGSRIPPFADPGEQLSCDANVLLLA